MPTLIAQAVRYLAAQYQLWSQRQQAYAELAQLDDRSLADIGITRSEIPYVIAHPRAARAPLWAERARRHSHA